MSHSKRRLNRCIMHVAGNDFKYCFQFGFFRRRRVHDVHGGKEKKAGSRNTGHAEAEGEFAWEGGKQIPGTETKD